MGRNPFCFDGITSCGDTQTKAPQLKAERLLGLIQY
jgi:hypothetical protein